MQAGTSPIFTSEKLKVALEKRDLKHLVEVQEEVKPTTEENLLDALKASLEG